MANECGKDSCIGCENFYENVRYCRKHNCFIEKYEENGKQYWGRRI